MESKSKPQIQIKTRVNNLDVNPENSSIPVLLCGDRLFIEPHKEEAEGELKTASVVTSQDGEKIKILKPIGHQEDYMAGTIVAKGPGYPPDFLIPEELKPGVVVNYFYQRGIPFEVNGKEYHLVRANDVILIL